MYNTFYSVRSHQRMQYSSGAINVHVLYMYTLYMYINVHYIIIHKREHPFNCLFEQARVLSRQCRAKISAVVALFQD